MVQENHIDKALAFMESLEKLGNQLKAAEEHQKQLIARMLDLKKENLTDGEEYAELSQKSKSLQDIIDKWRPIYLERMEMVKSVSIQKRKRNNKISLSNVWLSYLCLKQKGEGGVSYRCSREKSENQGAE